MGALVTSGSAVGGRSDPRQPGGSTMSLEVVRAMREAGAVKALAQALKLINTEHPKVRWPVGEGLEGAGMHSSCQHSHSFHVFALSPFAKCCTVAQCVHNSLTLLCAVLSPAIVRVS